MVFLLMRKTLTAFACVGLPFSMAVSPSIHSDIGIPYETATDAQFGSHDIFEHFKLFMEFQQHRDVLLQWRRHHAEFMTWRQSKTEEVSHFMTWLLPQQRTNPAVSTSHDRNDDFHRVTDDAHGESASSLQNGLQKAWNHFQASGVYEFIMQLYQARLEKQYATFGPEKWYLRYFCDVFLVLAIIVVVVLYYNGGFFGIIRGFWEAIQSTVANTANFLMGEKVVTHLEGGVVDFEEEEDNAIEECGVAKPPQMMYTRRFADLTPGQQHIFGELGFTDETWDEVRVACEESQWSIPPPNDAWSDLSMLNQERLRALGFTRRSWDLDDPDNLLINQKRWIDMSNYEKKQAMAAGIDVDNEGVEAWDERKSKVFRTEFCDLQADQHIHLRNLGFYRHMWVPTREPKVPEETMGNVCLQWLEYPLFLLWLAFEIIFLCWFLYEVGILQYFWKNLVVYIVFVLVAAAILVATVRTLFIPQMKRAHQTASIHIHVIMTHMRDLWDMVSNLCLNVCGENFNCCRGDKCCLYRCSCKWSGSSVSSSRSLTNSTKSGCFQMGRPGPRRSSGARLRPLLTIFEDSPARR